jgi:hypothetical protein
MPLGASVGSTDAAISARNRFDPRSFRRGVLNSRRIRDRHKGVTDSRQVRHKHPDAPSKRSSCRLVAPTIGTPSRSCSSLRATIVSEYHRLWRRWPIRADRRNGRSSFAPRSSRRISERTSSWCAWTRVLRRRTSHRNRKTWVWKVLSREPMSCGRRAVRESQHESFLSGTPCRADRCPRDSSSTPPTS